MRGVTVSKSRKERGYENEVGYPDLATLWFITSHLFLREIPIAFPLACSYNRVPNALDAVAFALFFSAGENHEYLRRRETV
jgi:hypothetical protein